MAKIHFATPGVAAPTTEDTETVSPGQHPLKCDRAVGF